MPLTERSFHVRRGDARLYTAEFRSLIDSASDVERAGIVEFERLTQELLEECRDLEDERLAAGLCKWPPKGADPAESVKALGALRRADLLQFSALFKMQELKMLRLERRISELEEAATKP